MLKPFVVIPHRFQDTFLQEAERYKIICLSAGAGWGKTTVVNKLLERQNTSYLSLREKPLRRRFAKEKWIVLDDVQDIPPQMEPQLWEILRQSSPGQHFFLLSRAAVPDSLSLYTAAGALLQFGTAELALDMSCIAQLVQRYGLTLSAHDVQRIRWETEGCPAAVSVLLSALAAGQPFHQAVGTMRSRLEVYMEDAALRGLDRKTRKLLAKLSLFDVFDLSLAEGLTEDGASSSWKLLQRNGLIVKNGMSWRMAGQRFLRPYLREKNLTAWAPELPGILVQYTRRSPDPASLYRMHGAYECLSEEEVRRSPDLICAMSMLQSMNFEPEESERWYGVLQEYIQQMRDGDRDYRRVLGLQAYLDVSLPHRGTAGLPELCSNLCAMLSSEAITLPEIHITSGLPSVLRGGKDLSLWTSGNPADFEWLRTSGEQALGRFAVGLWELLQTEILLEKGQDVSGQFLTLPALQKELRTKGAPETEFVLAALLVRVLCMAGSLQKAQQHLERFRSEAAREAGWLLPNLDAMRCRLSLLEDSAFSGIWFSEQAPDESSFCPMERYRYLTKVRCYIKRREYHAALLLLGGMLDYTGRYDRPLDRLETLVLTAICRYRMGSGDWKEHFSRALNLGVQYGYVTVFTQEGAALLPLLEQFGCDGIETEYWTRILSGVVAQAGHYEQYLQPLDRPPSRLTPAEDMILRLISQDKSNKEICSLLNIKLPTAKTHIRNLFKKLNVTSRTEAQKTARRFGII